MKPAGGKMEVGKMTRRSMFSLIGGLFYATARAQQDKTANVMFNACVVNKGYELNPQECQECGAGFVYQQERPTLSQRPKFCPNCGGRNIGLKEADNGS